MNITEEEQARRAETFRQARHSTEMGADVSNEAS